MQKITQILLVTVMAFGLNACGSQTNKEVNEATNSDPKIVQTRIGELEFSHAFEHGFPTDETVKKLYDEMDFQRACQAYLWGLPFVSLAEWYDQQKTVFNAKDGDFVIYSEYKISKASSLRI